MIQNSAPFKYHLVVLVCHPNEWFKNIFRKQNWSKKRRIWLQKRFRLIVIQYDNNNIEEGENTIVDIAIGTSYMARINQ